MVEEARSGLDGAAGALEGPGAIAVAPNGTVFVAQRRAAAVHVYRPDGSFAQAIGRDGSGPGEIRSLDAVGLLGDSLWVADANLQRLTFFTLDGKYLGSVRVSLPPRPPFGNALPETVLRDGTVVGVPMVYMSPSVALRQTLLRFTRDGIVRNTLRWLSLEHHDGVLRVGGGTLNYAQPFSDAPLRDASTNGTGLVVVDRPAATMSGTATFTVTRFGARGAQLYSRPISYTPRRLPRRVIDSASTAMETMFTGRSKNKSTGGRPPIDTKAFRASLYRPTYYPPVTQVVAANDGSVLLQMTEAASMGTYKVLDLMGVPTATVTFPKGLTLRYATATHAWVFGTKDDVPYLARYRIVKR